MHLTTLEVPLYDIRRNAVSDSFPRTSTRFRPIFCETHINGASTKIEEAAEVEEAAEEEGEMAEEDNDVKAE